VARFRCGFGVTMTLKTIQMQIHGNMAPVTEPRSTGATLRVGVTRPAIIKSYLSSYSVSHSVVANLFQEVHVGKARITLKFRLDDAPLSILRVGQLEKRFGAST
jgi:hypothetical protein